MRSPEEEMRPQTSVPVRLYCVLCVSFLHSPEYRVFVLASFGTEPPFLLVPHATTLPHLPERHMFEG